MGLFPPSFYHKPTTTPPIRVETNFPCGKKTFSVRAMSGHLLQGIKCGVLNVYHGDALVLSLMDVDMLIMNKYYMIIVKQVRHTISMD